MEFTVATKYKEMDNEQREAAESLRLFGPGNMHVFVQCIEFCTPSLVTLMEGATPWSLNDTADTCVCVKENITVLLCSLKAFYLVCGESETSYNHHKLQHLNRIFSLGEELSALTEEGEGLRLPVIPQIRSYRGDVF